MTAADADPAFAPLVSVIIPAYNRAHLIGRALASVLAQSYRNFEIIVVDDASTDDLAATLAKVDSGQLRCVTHPRNRGAAASRNTGVAAASGEFVAFLDSDDAWFPDQLTQQVAAMRDQPSDVVGHVCAYDCLKAGDGPRVIAPGWSPLTFRRYQLFGCTCGPGTTLLCRRSIFAELGPLDEELRRLEDWDWLLRLSEKGYRLLASPAVLARVEVSSGASGRHILSALQRIGERHGPTVAREGVVSRRIFQSTLHLETAAAAASDKAYARALAAMLRSFLCYPLRGGELYWRLLQRTARWLTLGSMRRTTAADDAGRPSLVNR
jgi:glycosyltransferase involved in cell wall biosynthesis